MILAIAGRRIDAGGAKVARFPLAGIEQVSQAVHALLIQKGVTAVVGSAACGADLIALSEAGKLNLRRRVVLPLGRKEFRDKSVIDRPGDWGVLYDRIIDEVSANGDLEIMNKRGKLDPFTAASQKILEEAIALARKGQETVSAAIIWDGIERGKSDYTAEFAKDARRRGLEVFEIQTV